MRPSIRPLALPLVALILALTAASAAGAAGLTPIASSPAPVPLGSAPSVTPAPTTQQPVPPPPYEDQLLRLSEILGAVHYLRQICGADDSMVWRDEMQKLLDAEHPDAGRHARMVDRFNHGYESFRSVYLTCTPAASAAIQRYLEEGVKIITDVSARYGR
jgi:uncharacterized protein (TIGR02301 family)